MRMIRLEMESSFQTLEQDTGNYQPCSVVASKSSPSIKKMTGLLDKHSNSFEPTIL